MNHADASNLKSLQSIKRVFINRLDFVPWTVSQVSQTRQSGGKAEGRADG